MTEADGWTRSGPVLVAWSGSTVDASELDGLSATDAARASALAGPARSRFVLGRRLVGRLVGELFPDARGWRLGADVCVDCGLAHGAVRVEGLPVVASISHTTGLTVAAAASAISVSRLGVDAEADALAPQRADELARLLGGSAAASLLRWTQVEAVLKADGAGLRLDPASVRLGRGRAFVGGDPGGYRLIGVRGPDGFLISVAWRAAAASAAVGGPASR